MEDKFPMRVAVDGSQLEEDFYLVYKFWRNTLSSNSNVPCAWMRKRQSFGLVLRTHTQGKQHVDAQLIGRLARQIATEDIEIMHPTHKKLALLGGQKKNCR